ncbi:hypothetical protein N7474_001209 [Penicillium riverlandense]|uniref:uncharacterized protein n=1 Tax=Penicillium riverlandense TaxID=1903569 RepID=UPI00254680CD|nr:uncharacterized protein N7474_001209 [Penicillium riverlandense]KAJ5832898.1 hypothetical protein N7474_001209 [Penicillium riverlandense]
MPPFGQTIAVIDKSGKVVSTSKQLFGVFNQAKSAYRERKSQYDSERSAKAAEQQALQGLATYQIDDSPAAGNRRTHGSKSKHHSTRHHHRRRTSSHYEQSTTSRGDTYYAPPQEIARRHTHHDITIRPSENQIETRPTTARSKSDAHIDMNLAYGEAHPDALSRYSPEELKIEDKKQLDGLVRRAQWLLEEAHCVQHSASATITHLQKHPDAMAAVALTLAEISNLATKMAPAALSAFRNAAPTVFALLSSPQFLIAAGVGLGVTVVMFGGYKIIKKISSGKDDAENTSAGVDEMMELQNMDSLGRLENWRRGVADVEAVSFGTSVDGEFITPTAAAMSGMDVRTAHIPRDPRSMCQEDASVSSSRRSRRSSRDTHTHTRKEKRVEVPPRGSSRLFRRESTKALASTPSRASSTRTSSKAGTAKPRTGTGSQSSEQDQRPKEKKKKGPSRLRLMFTH